MKKVLVVAGPTAVGKSDFAVDIALQEKGEIISGDSVQVYRGLNIGSGKITEKEKRGVPHYLIDIRDPKEPYSVSDFQKEARALIEKIDFPIIAGGTGLYLKACLYDYSFQKETEDTFSDPELDTYTNVELYEQLKKLDPLQAKKIHPNNRRRVLRSLTILRRTGKRQSDIEKQQSHKMIYDAFIVGCTMERSILYERINQRVETMVKKGLEEEVRSLLKQGITFADPGMQGIGYREWKPYFEGMCSREEVIENIQKNSRHYAKRQYTWLNHQMPVHWVDMQKEEDKRKMMRTIEEWRHS